MRAAVVINAPLSMRATSCTFSESLREITEAQAKALEVKLEEMGQDVKIYIGMRYWHPFTEEAIAQIKNDGIKSDDSGLIRIT